MRRSAVSIRESNEGLVFRSPYDAGLVAALKSQIPHSDRKWDPAAKAWIVAPQHAGVLEMIVNRHLGVSVSVPKVSAAAATETRLLRIEYLGVPKDRGSEVTAFGWCDGDWSVIIPLAALENWFCVESRPDTGVTYYAKLGVRQSATDGEIRSAFRRLARQWHPDVCKEPDAAEQFRTIRGAYNVLSDGTQRARYDAGMQFMATLRAEETRQMRDALNANMWRPPLRCGWLLVEGIQLVGRFVVSRIIQWEDVVNERGEVMVSFWPTGATQFEVRWEVP